MNPLDDINAQIKLLEHWIAMLMKLRDYLLRERHEIELKEKMK
jgi:hypothetical protein